MRLSKAEIVIAFKISLYVFVTIKLKIDFYRVSIPSTNSLQLFDYRVLDLRTQPRFLGRPDLLIHAEKYECTKNVFSWREEHKNFMHVISAETAKNTGTHIAKTAISFGVSGFRSLKILIGWNIARTHLNASHVHWFFCLKL